MVKVAESKRPATSFLQLLLEKEEQACAHCGLSVACGADVSMCAGSGRALLKATTLRTKQSDLLNGRLACFNPIGTNVKLCTVHLVVKLK